MLTLCVHGSEKSLVDFGVVGDGQADDTMESKNSVVIRDSENCTLSGLHISEIWDQPAAVTIQRSKRIIVSDCIVVDSTGILTELV